ncbi:monosaccharide ABC transporter membrane protein, CUT2 family [Georgenia satyanarayanai]|uniref:Monosaccharide ABC transporter membrane protein, CUT2 family n=1 Tax=Georgenia satyanarayanai TaxID=860221 RepID=A0A2Y8ZYP0_9MICO|nr:ABC transporter permease [Georgenia satyanarayanai]PYG01903.1 monosaccharide ABC transporter membrane protein (CUT2 family) [Georgenia satyanarayanai]SSA36706.1 monosaccharide ABC transporter membrane protein, CUT2 family [Georgenia satyanarayanai]
MSTTTAAPPTPSHRLRTLTTDRPVIVLGVVFVVFYLVTGLLDPSLFTSGGLRSILLLACPLAIFAAGQTIAFLTGGIDLSVTMVANFAAYVAATQSGAGPLQAIALALTVGAVAGFVNGVGVGVFRVHPLIMTIGMSSVLLGVVSVGLASGGFLTGAASVLPVLSTVGGGTLVGPIPLNVVVWAAVAVVLLLGLSRTGLGRNIYAVGDNPVACRLSGVKVWQVLIATYVIVGVLAAIAGLLISGSSGSVGPSQTNSFLLPSIAAAVIGGTSILGGSGGYAGTIVGALVLTVLNRLLLTLGVGQAVQQIVYGVIVLGLAWVYVAVSGQRSD